MRKFILFIFLLVFSLGAPCQIMSKDAKPDIISLKDAKALLDQKDVIIIDVRTPAEFAQGHIPGARNMDFFGGRFDVDAETLPKDKPVLLYCRSGKRSGGAAEILEKAGVKKIMDMQQGFQAWEKAGLPIEK